MKRSDVIDAAIVGLLFTASLLMLVKGLNWAFSPRNK
jgi:hypothetical protein